MEQGSQQELQTLYTTHSENNQLTLDQALLAFSKLNYKPSKKDSQQIFNTLKSYNTNHLTFEQFEFWWNSLKQIQSQDYLVKLYVKLWKIKRKISEKIKGKGGCCSEGDCQGNFLRVGVGKVDEEKKEKLTKLRINFKNGVNEKKVEEKSNSIRQLLEIPEKDLAFVVQIKLSEGIDQQKCGQNLQQLIKSIVTVGTSLHKGTKQILSKISFSTKTLNGNAFIIAKIEKNLMEMIVNGIQIVQDYLEKIQPEEEFELKIVKENDLMELFEAMKSQDPKTALPLLFNNSEICISTLACRFFQLIQEYKDLEKLNTPIFQLLFAFLVLLKSLKFDMQLKNFDQEDKWLEEYSYFLPKLNNQKLPLPNMNIIKKLKDFSFNYLESFFKIYLLGPKLKIKTEVSLPKLSSVLTQSLEF